MQFKKTVLDNGLRIITAPQPGNLAVTVLVLVEAGSKYETKDQGKYNRGVSHFLEHMCFKGTEKRKDSLQISSELDGLGASYNAFTGLEYTGYYAKVQSKDFDKALDLISDVYLNPVFKSEEIEKEKGVVIEEINMYEDDPPHKVAELFMELMYGDTPAGWDISGSREDILKLDQKRILDYRKSHYVAAGTVVIVAGALDEESALKKIKTSFAGIEAASKGGKIKTVEQQTKPELRIKYKESDQTHIVLGCRAFPISDQRRNALEILGHILGGGMSSRLFQILRNKLGAAYYVSAGADFYTDHGLLAVAAGIDKNKISPVISEIMAEFKNLCDELVPKQELERVKNHLSGGTILGLETSNRLASFYGHQEMVERHILTPEEAIKEIQAVTAEEIRSVARDIFKDENLNLAVLGPIKDETALQNLLRVG